MKFNVTSPCAHCPFRRDVPGYLHPERVRELADMLTDDDLSWFACHETTTSKGRSTRHRDAAPCAGAMIIQEKRGRTAVVTRIAKAVGLFKKLNMEAPVFDTFEEFVEHHTKAYRRTK